MTKSNQLTEVIETINIMKQVKLFEQFIKEGYYSGYDYKKWAEANGKIKWPKWCKPLMKEIIKAGFMDKVYGAEHNYIYLMWNSLSNDEKFDTDKRKKAMGEKAAKLINDKYNDITGYTAFEFQAAAIALSVSKHVKDMQANGESIEPAYYLAKEYFKNHGMDYNRSRTFNSTVKKLSAWMNDPRNKIKTL